MSIVPTLWGERHDPEAKASIQDIQMVATLSTNVVDDDDDNDLKRLGFSSPGVGWVIKTFFSNCANFANCMEIAFLETALTIPRKTQVAEKAQTRPQYAARHNAKEKKTKAQTFCTAASL